MTRLLVALWAAFALVSGRADAHDLRPAYLSITESAPEIYSVLWKAPAMGERRLAVYPRLPLTAVERAPHEGAILNDAYVERWTVHAPTGFAGETITFDGLPESRADVLVRLERLSGEVSTARLTPTNPSLTVPAATVWHQVAATYVWLGVEHILFGVDHLLFVLALILLAGSWKRIAITVTAFTLAHSITLAAATLGYLNVPGPPVEAAIALSIVLVAVEIVKSRQAGEASLTARLPWLVAFAFGLLHGLGFAGALSEIGLPHHAIPVALLFFNIGVELGQLTFAATVLAAFAILGRLSIGLFRSQGAPHAWARAAAAYCIGAIASFWLIERVGGFWT